MNSMKTSTTTKTSLSRQMARLRREVSALRSLMIGVVGKDKEGNYRPQVVREILEASAESATYRYTGKGSLLAKLKKL